MAEYSMKILIRFEFFGGGSAKVTEAGNDVVFHCILRMKNNGTVYIDFRCNNGFIILFKKADSLLLVPMLKHPHSCCSPAICTITYKEEDGVLLFSKEAVNMMSNSKADFCIRTGLKVGSTDPVKSERHYIIRKLGIILKIAHAISKIYVINNFLVSCKLI